MRAVVLTGVGGPENLVVEDVPEPTPADRQTVVDVRACGINFADVLIRLGRYPQMPDLPTVLGSEIAGELDGDRVMGFARGDTGGYAERAVVDPRWLLPLPTEATFAEGAAFPMAFITAWIPLTQILRVGFGARVLVTAAAGAVGTAAIQLVRALNGQPVAAVGSEAKFELARSLGAIETVTYERIAELEPVDAVLRHGRRRCLHDSLSLIQPLGTMVAVGYAGGLWDDVSPTWLVGRNIGVHGFFLDRLLRRAPEVVEQAGRDVLRLWEGGVVRPIVGAEFPLEQAGKRTG